MKYRSRKCVSLVCMLLACVAVRSQISSGKVYNFVNVGNVGQSMSIVDNNRVSIVTTDDNNYEQLWYVVRNSDDSYSLRNLASGRYLRSSNVTSSAWTMVRGDELDGNCKFCCVSVGAGYTLRATNTTDGYHYMHYGVNNGGVVCWESSATATQWTISEVGVSDEALTANWERLTEVDPDAATVTTYETALDNLFSDKACTTLKKSFASESAVTADADYKNLPEALQTMVLKVYRNNWAEGNGDTGKKAWDTDYARKYRVQLYEPYNEPGAAATALGVNVHTNMNNPTGIYSDGGQTLYVMVDGEIEDGASLYLASYVGHGKLGEYSEGVQLKQGLNVVPSFTDGNNYCVNYVVHTFDTSDGKRGRNARARRLSDYEDLKIHIEGGYINGYYNKVGDALYTPDKNADWEYIELRATQTDVTVLGEYLTLQFPLNDADTEGNKGMGTYLNERVKIEPVIDEWDNVMLWERLVLGVLGEATIKAEAKKSPYSEKDYVFESTAGDGDEYAADYGDYYNVHGLAFGVGGDAYMYGGWDHCGYHYNTMGGVIEALPTNAGAHWGPGHEIGHQHQALLTVNGLTEVTNNLFANVVLWYYGETTSRYNGDNGSLTNVLAAYNTEGADFFTNNIWALTHMYYKLFLYYHVLGHNPKFYPRLFEMLRQDPMSRGYVQQGNTTLLHFYKKCCLASGDDLTEFFRAYGFFSVMDSRLVGDYSNSEYTQTQDDIDAAIAEVKDWGFEENLSVIFINDATGETIKSHKGDNLDFYGESVVCAEVGSYASFPGNAASDYTYAVTGNTVTMTGEGGVGFAIYNTEGELIAFSDKKTFEISDECAALIASGEVEFKVVNADNSTSAPMDVMDSDDSEAKYTALGKLLERVEAIVKLSDETGTKVGYYRKSSLTDLISAYNTAKQVYDDKTVASYAAVCDVLYQEYANVQNDGYAYIGVVGGNAYRLVNKAYPERSMSIDANKVMLGEATDEDADTQRWYFEESDTRGAYYIKNKSTQTYPGNVSTGAELSATATSAADAHAYRLEYMDNGLWALVGATGLHCSSSQGYKIVGWGTGSDATQWYITAVEVDAETEKRNELEYLIEKTESLVNEMAMVQYKGNVDLVSCSVTSNAPEPGHGIELSYDNNPDTYFHTVWKDSPVAEEHYIQVDLGEGKSLAEFVWTYTTYTTPWGKDFPTEVEVTGSNDALLWHDIKTLSDLPTDQNTAYSADLGSSNNAYRYLRFTVTATTSSGKYNGYYYFGLAEFGLGRSSTQVNLYADYSPYITTNEMVMACDEVLEALVMCGNASATKQDYMTAIAELQVQYDMLLAAYNEAKEAVLAAKKAELQELIGNTASLISSCGSVTYMPATLGGELALQASDAGASWYVSTNADQNTGGESKDGDGIAALVDGSLNTYFHTRWSGAVVNEPHYIQVDMGEGVAINDFVFSYTPRNGSPAPTEMTISGSNDGSDFNDVITTVSKEWGDYNNDVTYTSELIESAKAYRYLRFTVTASNGPGTEAYEGFYFFGMKELDIIAIGRPESYNVELGANSGDATEELMIAAYAENASAQATYEMATTVNQIEEAIAKLQADYEALDLAKNSHSYVTYTIQVVGGDANGGVAYRNKTYAHNATFRAPVDLTASAFTAITLEGYTEGVVTVIGTTVTVIYQKIYTYTVRVTGGDGTGGVTFNSSEYVEADIIVIIGQIDGEQLVAKDIDGYNEGVIIVDHENSTITVAYTMTPLVDTTKYYTLECRSEYAHNTTRFIRDNGSIINGRSAEGSLFRFEAANEENGYYIKSYVTDKYLNHTEGAIYASGEKNTIWTMAKPSHTLEARTLTVGDNLYLNNNGSDCTDGSCTNLQSNLHNTGVGSGNACSLWTLTETEPLDKSALNTLIGEVNSLVESCYTDETFNYAGSLNVTEQLMTAIREAVDAAQEKYESKATTASEYEAALTALQAAKDNLQTAINYAELPVQITLDANTPVTYKIALQRDGAPILQYDNSTAMVAVASTYLLGDKSQAWYFMPATDGKVYIMPYYAGNTTLALSANNFSEGNSKVKGMATGSEGYTQEWTITNEHMNEENRNVGWYNITCTSNGTDTWYFSNYGGVANKMGFYNDANDKGTLFKFEQVIIDKTEAYYALYNYYTNDVKFATGSVVGGDAVGHFSAILAGAYNTAYNNATMVLGSETAADDDYTSAYNALVAANEALVINMPEEGKFYRLRSVARGSDQAPEYAYVNPDENRIFHTSSRGTDDATTIWTFAETANGAYNMTNLHTGTSLANNGWQLYTALPLYDDAGNISIVPLSTDGQVGIWCGDIMLHADGNGKVVHWETGANGGSAWRIEEVEDISLVQFALTIGEYCHAGLYLNYPVAIPEGVKAYIIDGSDIEVDSEGTGTLTLNKLKGKVLPARTAVILDAPSATYSFYYTDEDAADDVSGNRLYGSPYLVYKEAADNHKYYVFGQKKGEVGLYKNSVKYDASGKEVDAATHYKVSANKICFAWDCSTNNVSAFRFRVRGTTDMAPANESDAQQPVIYNIYGHRVSKVVTSGVYIVNGNKLYVHVR